MATTCNFEGTIRDKEDKGTPLDPEFGRSSFYGGVSLMYFVVDGKSVIVAEGAYSLSQTQVLPFGGSSSV
jgi:hypothetical protein